MFHCFDPCKLFRYCIWGTKIKQIYENAKLLLIFLAYIAFGTMGISASALGYITLIAREHNPHRPSTNLAAAYYLMLCLTYIPQNPTYI